MSAYLSVMVHNALGPGASGSTAGIRDMLETKYFVYLYVDDREPMKLRAARQPHMIPIDAGAHTIAITRKPMGKKGIVGGVNIGVGAIMGAVVGGEVGAALGGRFADKMVSEDGLKNAKVIEVCEGETVACDVKANWRGMPKVKWL